MKDSAYYRLSQQEQINWYYLSRRKGLEGIIKKIISPSGKHLKIADVGCGPGGTTNFLTQFGEVTALEYSEIAINLAKQNYPHLNIIQGSLQEINKAFQNDNFDLCTILSVLYHKNVDSPPTVIKDIGTKLKPGGWLIWQEPVYPVLRREMDDDVQGSRRFLPSEMQQIVNGAGFTIRFKTHLTMWGFPVALIMAQLYKLRASNREQKQGNYQSPDLKTPNAVINKILYIFARFEWAVALNLFSLPMGVSYLILAQKSTE